VDILWTLLTLPYAPVRGLTAVINVIAREAEAKRYNPANIAREVEEQDRAVERGEISPQERDEAQKRILEPLTTVTPNQTGQG
jgi:hypothetical protein